MSAERPEQDRLGRAQALLNAHRFSAEPSVAGHAGDILAVPAPLARLGELRALSAQLKNFGFRYITLELDPEDRT